MSGLPDSQAGSNPELQALLALRRMKARLETMEQTLHEPIAILGMGCRFPGSVQGPEALWEFLREGGDAITEVPEGRWSHAGSCPARSGQVVPRWGGFVADIDQFDAAFFGIAPREAMYMDPQQRMLLEVSWEAFENAMLAVDHLAGTKTGVFVGVSNSEYSHFQYQDSPYKDPYLTTGTSFSILANRLSYFFNFCGPSLTVDTACSSSLVALHIACQALRNQECEVALVAGVNLLMTPVPTEAFTTWGMLAVDGSCKTFDARANGFVRSEGVGVLILKRLSQAKADGDPILALIRGSAVNQDGRSNGLTAPNERAQQEVLRQALKNARVLPEEVEYIETHGTGTPLGDPIEVEALTAVYGHAPRAGKLFLGALKTNLGHLEAASGIAGVMKTVLALRHQEIPPNLHFQTLNPNISFEHTSFALPVSRQPWPAGKKPRYAGVSSFGFGGTNAHVILEEAPPVVAVPEAAEETDRRCLFLPLSARNAHALQALARSYQRLLSSTAESLLEAIAYSACARRVHHSFRLAVCGSSNEEVTEGLKAFLQGTEHTGLYAGQVEAAFKSSLVFVFPGQGSQWPGMGQRLLQQEPVFRAMIEKCEEIMRSYVTWSLLDILQNPLPIFFEQIEIMQPMLFAIQVALASLWQSWGLRPDVVIGHSMGEVAAAYVAGILSLEDACRVICRRSQLLKRVSGQGAMAVVELSLEQAREAILGYEHQVSLAVSNSRRSTVLSGNPAALEEILQPLQQRGIFCRHIKVDVASHSPQMDVLRDDLLSALQDLRPRKAQISMYSTVTATGISGPELDASYWVENLRQPVLFAATIQQLIKEERVHFLELSPHPLLTAAIEEELRYAEVAGLSCPSLRRNVAETETLAFALAALYSQGYTPRWDTLSSSASARRFVSLPSYPWQHERFWVEGEKQSSVQEERRSGRISDRGHPFIGTHLVSALEPKTHYWQSSLSVEDLPYLRDHQIHGQVVLAGAVFLEVALAAGRTLFKTAPCSLESVTFDRMLRLNDADAHLVQIVLTETAPDLATFQIFSAPEQRAETDSSSPCQWLSHARGVLRLQRHEEPDETNVEAELRRVLFQSSCEEDISQEQVYQQLQAQGLTYGPGFQSIQRIWKKGRRVLASLNSPSEIGEESARYHIHPAILDGCFQVLAFASALQGQTNNATYVPVGVDQYTQFIDLAYAQPPFWVSFQLALPEENSSNQPLQTLSGQLALSDAQGRPILALHGLHIQRVESLPPAHEDAWNKWCYHLSWQIQKRVPRPTHQKTVTAEKSGNWLIFANQTSGKQLQSLLAEYGQSCTLVAPGEEYARIQEDVYQINPTLADDFQRLLKESSGRNGRYRGIVHLWSLGNWPQMADSLASLAESQKSGYGSVLHLVQSLVQAGWRDLPRLWLITSGAQSIDRQTGSLSSIAQAPLWGLGRTIMFEHPGLNCSLLDLGEQGEEYRSLVEELLAEEEENQIALRGPARYVARLMPFSLRAEGPNAQQAMGAEADFGISPTATYMISGGLGGLGLTVAKWLGEQGARSLFLVGRSHVSSQAREVATELQKAGVKVRVALKDISQPGQVAELIEEIEQSGMPLRGIIHAAGLLDDGVLLHQTFQRFQNVMAPKIAGAWNLHQYTKDMKLDFFVLFSSAASLLGSPGQANYAAANAFLDALAHYRRSIQLPALSINWGPWAEVGLAARPDSHAHLTSQGIESMQPSEGLAAFAAALKNAATQIAILPFHVRRWRQFHPQMAQLPLLSLLEDAEHDSNRGDQLQILRRNMLSTSAGPERRALFETFLLQHITFVLRRSQTAIDRHAPFSTLGMDSMMAMELRNRLESSLKLLLPNTLIWAYPTLSTLSTHLAEEIGITLDADEGGTPEQEVLPAEKALPQQAQSNMDTYSEDELLQLLIEELDSAGEKDK